MTAAVATGGFLKPRVANKMHKSVTSEDQIAFFRQLCTLFRAGTPLLEALNIAGMQSESIRLQQTIQTIAGKVSAGSALWESLGDYPKIFKVEWVEVVKSGEDCGELGNVLESLVKQIDAASQLKSQIMGAMMYPMIIMVVAAAAVTVMLIVVVPTFASMFDAFGKELPGITQAVLDLSDFLQAKIWHLIGGLTLVTVAFRRYIETPGGKRIWHGTHVSLPLIGDVVVQAQMQKFANNLALLLRAGMPLHDAILSLRGIFQSNVIYQSALNGVASRVGSGGSLADALDETAVFTPFVIKMIRVGEESGTLIEVLDQIDQFYARKVASIVGRVTGMLETVAILGMGIAVAVILCAIYLPLFSMASGV